MVFLKSKNFHPNRTNHIRWIHSHSHSLMKTHKPIRIGVLTSGGDAPGMNPAVRAVVRAALKRGADVYAIHEGYYGMVFGGELIQKMKWDDVSGVIHKVWCESKDVLQNRRVARVLELEDVKNL